MRQLFFLLAFLTSTVFAQDVQVKWGVENKYNKKFKTYGVVHENEEFFYTLSYRYKLFSTPIYMMNKYEKKKYKLVSTKEIEIQGGKNDKNDYSFFSTVEFNNDLYLLKLQEKHKSKNATKLLLMQKINDDCTLDETITVIDTVSGVVKSGWFGKSEGAFDMRVSKDQSKMLIVRHVPAKDNAKEKFNLKIFDKDFSNLFNGELELKSKDKFFLGSSYRITDEGNLFIMGKEFKTEESTSFTGKKKEKAKRAKKGKPNYNYSLFYYNIATTDLKEYKVDLPNKYITDIQYSYLAEKDEIICAGFYSAKKTYSIGGTFYIRINAMDATVVKKTIKEFDAEFLALFMSEKKAKKKAAKGNNELYEFDLDELVIKEDGGVVLIAEQFFIRVVTTTDSKGNSRTTYHYYYNDILVINFTPDADVKWYARIPKIQHSVNDNGFFSSYLFTVHNDKMYFIFNDNRKNIARLAEGKKVRSMGSAKKSVATMVVLDEEGNMERTTLFSAKEQKIVLRPKETMSDIDNNSNKLFIYGLRYGLFVAPKYKYGTLTIK